MLFITAGVVLILLVWLGIGFAGAGYTFAYFQRKYPLTRKRDFYLDRQLVKSEIWLGPVGMFKFMSLKKYNHGWLNPWGLVAKQEAGLI